MIRRGDRDGVDIFVLKQLANVAIALRPRHAHLLRVTQALVQYTFVDIAHGSNLYARDIGKPLEVIIAAATQSANGEPHTIIGSEHSPSQSKRGRSYSHCLSCGL